MKKAKITLVDDSIVPGGVYVVDIPLLPYTNERGQIATVPIGTPVNDRRYLMYGLEYGQGFVYKKGENHVIIVPPSQIKKVELINDINNELTSNK